jgi:hypothetical protein
VEEERGPLNAHFGPWEGFDPPLFMVEVFKGHGGDIQGGICLRDRFGEGHGTGVHRSAREKFSIRGYFRDSIRDDIINPCRGSRRIQSSTRPACGFPQQTVRCSSPVRARAIRAAFLAAQETPRRTVTEQALIRGCPGTFTIVVLSGVVAAALGADDKSFRLRTSLLVVADAPAALTLDTCSVLFIGADIVGIFPKESRWGPLQGSNTNAMFIIEAESDVRRLLLLRQRGSRLHPSRFIQEHKAPANGVASQLGAEGVTRTELSVIPEVERDTHDDCLVAIAGNTAAVRAKGGKQK